MANVAVSERGKTREKLTKAATILFYEQGVGNTTLADVSAASGVPLGNIYYHFKTKDELTEAVIQRRGEALQATFASAENETTPLAKLLVIVNDSRNRSEELSRYGCPYASLASDLDKLGSEHDAAQLLRLYLDYAEEQFTALELAEPRALSGEFVSRLQGAHVLTHALKSEDALYTQLDRLEAWLKSL